MAVAAVGRQWVKNPAPKRNKKQRVKSETQREGWSHKLAAAAARVSPRSDNTPQYRAIPKPGLLSLPAPKPSAGNAPRRATRKNLRQSSVATFSQTRDTSVVTQTWLKTRAKVRAGMNRLAGHTKALVIATALGTGFLVAAGGGLAAASYLSDSTIFHAKNLAFSPTSHVDLDEVRGLLAPAVDQSMWSLDLRDLESRIESAPWVANAKVVRMLPDTLKVEIEEHLPVARTGEGDAAWLIDSAGRLFQVPQKETSKSLPVIHGVKDPQVTPPQQQERRLQIALDALERFSQGSRPLVRSVQVGAADEIALELRDIPTRLHFEQSDLDRGLARFDALFNAAPDRFLPATGDAQKEVWAAVFFNGADRNRVVVRYADHQEDRVGPEAIVK